MATAQLKESLVPGEFVMTAEDFRRIATMLHADSGIAMNPGKATLVYSRLTKRLRALGLESFRAYCALVASAEPIAPWWRPPKGWTSASACSRR